MVFVQQPSADLNSLLWLTVMCLYCSGRWHIARYGFQQSSSKNNILLQYFYIFIIILTFCVVVFLFFLNYIFLYNLPDEIIDPGNIHLCIRGNSTSLVRQGTATRNIFVESFFSTPPNTHCPSTCLPRWYFLLPIYIILII